MTQQARQVAWTFAQRAEPVLFLLRDHDAKFSASFDAVFEAQGTQIVRTPIQAREANGIAERFVRTVRAECLDWPLILNPRHLQRVLYVFIDHYNIHRAHRALNLRPPDGPRPTAAPTDHQIATVIRRRDLLGGLVHEYERAA